MYKGDLIRSAIFGTVVNFPWEMAHSLLYRGSAGWTLTRHLICCGLASLADGIGIAIIFCFGSFVFRDAQWTRIRSVTRIAFAALLGLTQALIVEWVALRLDWWAYMPMMPRVPGTNLGVSPLVQF